MIARKRRLGGDCAGERRLSKTRRRAIAAAAVGLSGLAVIAPTASASSPPVITGEAASGVNYERAVLNGAVNPETLETTYHFEYGETTAYGTSVPTPEGNAGKGTSNVKVSQTLRGLKVGSTYHFRLVATNALGTTYGEDRSFTMASWAISGREPESAVAVISKGTLKIVHSPPALLGGGKITTECSIVSEGTVAGAGGGEISKVTLSGCKIVASTNPVCTTGSPAERPAAGDLPWRTTLVSAEGATRAALRKRQRTAPLRSRMQRDQNGWNGRYEHGAQLRFGRRQRYV